MVNRNNPEKLRYPVLLPSHHRTVKRQNFKKHIQNQRAGFGDLMSVLREDYWILKSRKCN